MLKPIHFAVISLCLIASTVGAQTPYKCLMDLAGENHKNVVTVVDILDAPFILHPDTVKKYPGLRVYKFNVYCTKNKDQVLIQTNSNRLSTEQFNAIGRADVGDKIYIEDILLSCPNGAIRKLSPLTFTIKGR